MAAHHARHSYTAASPRTRHDREPGHLLDDEYAYRAPACAGTRPWPGWTQFTYRGPLAYLTTTRYPARLHRPMAELIDQLADCRRPGRPMASANDYDDPGGGGMTTRTRPPTTTPSSASRRCHHRADQEGVPETGPPAPPRHQPRRPEAAERFKAITQAYEVLTDPARRQAYDATRPPVTPTTLTTPDQDGPAISGIVRVLEDIWRAIRARHGEIPAVVIIIASGTDGKQAVFGHHAPGRWVHRKRAARRNHDQRRRTAPHPRDVLGTLLHEAAHALAAARGIKDTSRQGRYHNTKYKMLAEELGITVTFDPTIGWSITTVPDATAEDLRRPARLPCKPP